MINLILRESDSFHLMDYDFAAYGILIDFIAYFIRKQKNTYFNFLCNQGN